MEKKQFTALIEFMDKRIDLQNNRADISSRFFYAKCQELKDKAIIDAGLDNTENSIL